MARNRMIKSEFWDDEKLSKVSLQARLIFIGIWTFSDDYGVVKGDVRWLKNHILPYEDSLSTQEFSGWLSELENIFIFPFQTNNESYYFIKNFQKHQTVNRPSKTKNPDPPDKLTEHSLNTHTPLTDEVKYKYKDKYKYKKTSSADADLELKNLTEKLYNKKIFSNVHSFVNKMLKHNKSRDAIMHTLKQCEKHGPFNSEADSWAYACKIIQVENGNYNEREAVAKAEKMKKDLQALVGEIGNF